MEITEVRIKLTEDSDDRLQAFCSITFDDCFVVRDLKVIEGTNGPFVAMPSRKLTGHCGRCGCKNHLRAAFCNHCGGKLNGERAVREQDGRARLYADIAHPINSRCREMIQDRVIEEFENEQELSKQPGYVSRYEDDYDDVYPGETFVEPAEEPQRAAEPVVERTTEVQPAEPEPQGPHTSPAAKRRPDEQPQTPHSRGPKRGFGAGILDD